MYARVEAKMKKLFFVASVGILFFNQLFSMERKRVIKKIPEPLWVSGFDLGNLNNLTPDDVEMELKKLAYGSDGLLKCKINGLHDTSKATLLHWAVWLNRPELV